MFEVFIATVIIIGLSMVLLSVRFICGKENFVNSHIDGNEPLNAKGIFCAGEQDKAQRSRPSMRIKEHS